MTQRKDDSRIDAARERLSNAVDAYGDTLSEYGEVARDRGAALARRTGEMARERPVTVALGALGVGLLAALIAKRDVVGEHARTTGRAVREKAGAAGMAGRDYARGHPMATGVATFAAGAAVGAMMPRALSSLRQSWNAREGAGTHADGALQGKGNSRGARAAKANGATKPSKSGVKRAGRSGKDDAAAAAKR